MDTRDSYEKYVTVTLQQEYRQHTDYFSTWETNHNKIYTLSLG